MNSLASVHLGPCHATYLDLAKVMCSHTAMLFFPLRTVDYFGATCRSHEPRVPLTSGFTLKTCSTTPLGTLSRAPQDWACQNYFAFWRFLPPQLTCRLPGGGTLALPGRNWCSSDSAFWALAAFKELNPCFLKLS